MEAEGESRNRIAAAEARLERLRDIIERRSRIGADATDAWRLLSVTESALDTMRQSERLVRLSGRVGHGDFGAVQAALLNGSGDRHISVHPGAVIQAAVRSAGNCYVVASGLVSLRFGGAEGVEVGMVRRGGVIGLQALLTGEALPFTAVATLPCQILPMPPEMLDQRLAAADHGLEFVHAAVAQHWAEAATLARCSAEHSIEQRVARWTLTAHHHSDGHIGPIPHHRLAHMLGVRRPSVTVALQKLEGEGAIRSTRNFIEVREEATLQRLSCECAALLARSSHVSLAALGPAQLLSLR